MYTFSQRVAEFVSAANEELRYIFTILAASESTSADNYFMSMDLLKQEYPDYETLRSLVSTAIQAEEVDGVGTAIAELRAFQNASKQLQAVIASGTVNSSDGYSMEEIAQTVGLIFDLEKTSFTETSKDYWSNVISHLHYRRYVSSGYWWWDYLDDNDFAVNDLTKKISYSNGQDNDSREATVYEIAHTHTYSLYQSLPLDKLDSAIAGLYASHWIYWDNCSEEYILLQDVITDLEAQVKQLVDSGASEAAIQMKTAELSDKQAQLQSLVDGEIYALDDDRLEAIQTVMTDTIEAMRLYTLWTIAYCACDGRVPDDAYHHILEIAGSTEYIHPRTAYQALCNYGVTPQTELANMVASFEKLEKDLLFLQSVSNGTDAITWNELSEELQRIFGAIDHQIYFIDYRKDYSSSLSVEDTPFPVDVMDEIRAEINKCGAAIGTVTKSNAKHRITYRYLDEENKQPWAQALGLLLTVYNAAYPFEYGTAEYTLADQPFSTEHSMWYEQGFRLSISVGVGSEDNFNESGLTVRQTRFKDAQENISYYHPMNKASKGAQRLFGGNIGLIYPDFISRDHETRVIADAKYKPLDNIGNKDYLQVLAYMLRFDAKKGYYLYPEAEGADDLQLWLNKGSTYEANVVPRDDICIIKHGLKIPIDAENYESFVSKMQVSESEFRQVFIG